MGAMLQLSQELGHVREAVGKLTHMRVGALSGVQVVQSIERVLTERDKLAKQVREQTHTTTQLEQRITQLYRKNEKYLEENKHLMESRFHSLQATVKDRQSMFSTLTQEKSDFSSKLTNSQTEQKNTCAHTD